MKLTFDTKAITIPLLGLSLLLSGCSSTPETAAADKARAAHLNVELGSVYLQQQQRGLAKQKYLKALSLNPQSAEAYAGLARCDAQAGDIKAAQHAYQEAVRLAPDDAAILNQYGVFLCQHQRFMEGETMLSQALAVPNNPQMAQTYENMGVCAMAGDQLNVAAVAFQHATEQAPERAMPYLHLGEIAAQQGRYHQAEAWLQQYNQRAEPTRESLTLALTLAKQAGDHNRIATIQLELQSLVSERAS